MRRMAIRSMVSCAALAILLPAAGRSQEINTTGGTDYWNAVSIYEDIAGNDWAYGQWFRAPTATTFLNTFSFWLVWHPSLGNAEFTAHLAVWEGSGPFTDIWESDPVQITEPSYFGQTNLAWFNEQVFSPGIALTAGQTYIAYLRNSNPLTYYCGPYCDPANGLSSGAVMAIRYRDWGESGLIYIRNGEFYSNPREVDAAFTADFTSPIPEPATVLLLATGLVGIGGVGLARRGKT